MGLATLLILTVTDSCNNQLKMRSLIIIITASLLSCNQKPKESPSASFEKDLEVLKEYNHIPGMAAIITKKGEII